MDSVNNNYLLIILGVIAVIVELLLGVVTGFDLLIIGVVLILSGSIGFLFGSFTIGLVATIVLSLLYVLFGRNFVKQNISIATTKTNSDALLGKKGKVVKKITSQMAGQVKVEGEIWRAHSKTTLDEGTTITVQSISGVTLTVILSS